MGGIVFTLNFPQLSEGGAVVQPHLELAVGTNGVQKLATFRLEGRLLRPVVMAHPRALGLLQSFAIPEFVQSFK